MKQSTTTSNTGMVRVIPPPGLPGMPCKPLHQDGIMRTLFAAECPLIGGTVSFRSFELETDLDTVHTWVNLEYAKAFWQLNGSKELVRETYEYIMQHPHGHSFMGLINDVPVAQLDVYQVLADELREHVEATATDVGLHLLMAPPRELGRGYTQSILQHMIRYLFSFDSIHRIYGEPDHLNDKANLLVRKTGFTFVRPIELSYKTANLYYIDRPTTTTGC